jgi:Na+-transporting NADH:ubiquinone oxidoreductase subunit B
MKIVRRVVDANARHFEPGGKLHRLAALWEAGHTFLFTPGHVTRSAPHVRDGLDLKRVMMTVIIALLGCIFMAMYNTGLQANTAIASGAAPLPGWRTDLLGAAGIAFDPASTLACLAHGALWYVPVLVVTFVVGIGWEVLFAAVRGHAVNEGFFVTGMLFPLILPATIPLWQVALGISFGVVIGKEVFGGTGMNILNPALVARAFLFFAYPAQISGDEVWIPARAFVVDVMSGATPLATATDTSAAGPSWWDAFLGVVPGSMGETSALACFAGAVVLVVTGVASWRILAGVVGGTVVAALAFNAGGSPTNPLFAMPFWWHFVLGGWAFGAVFMATDPVTASQTQTGRIVYGALIGVLVVVVRVLNPAYPEAMMLVILLVNIFAATIDHFVVEANVRRRRRRRAA